MNEEQTPIEIDVDDWFALHDDAMDAFTRLANRHGQDLEARCISEGLLAGAVLVRHAASHVPMAVLWSDGRIVDLTKNDDRS